MALAKIKAKQMAAVDRLAEGSDVYLRGLRDGSLAVANLAQALAIEGRVFICSVGTATDPVTFGGGALDTGEADLLVEVPVGTTILPLYLSVYMEAYGNTGTNIFEAIGAICTGGVASAYTCTHGGALTPVNMRSDSTNRSSCVVHYGCNTAEYTIGTANYVEFFRNGLPVAITKATAVEDIANLDSPTGFKFDWTAKETGMQPVVVGASQLQVYAQAQTGTGFIKFIYAELPSSCIQ